MTPVSNKKVGNAIRSLGIEDFVLYGEPKNEKDFNSMFRKVVGKDSSDSAILSSNPSDFGVTWSQIEPKITELQAQYEANEYQRQRAAEYPSWQDQLDKIYHDGVMTWQKEIKAIKDKYPKS